ncbi:MAG: methylisocitrate lyase [Salinibacter sp.]|uniref:methylisocitrate lyase n=1 Tax=Salinibacter sp. TaxID=2065818 RepID=UPI0035D4F60B
MLFVDTSPQEKRQALRDALEEDGILRLPGAFSPLVAMLFEEQGFDGIYISGAVLSADLGLPDVGLTTMTEVLGRGRQIARVTNLPSIIDIDTGFGETLNMARTLQELEEHGLAGCHLEDQVNPKRCGHLDHKSLVPTETMIQKIRAAVEARRDPNFLLIARTDARSVDGMGAALDRAQAYVDAGADALFPEGLRTEEEFATFGDAFDVPLLANMTEFGKSPLLEASRLDELGYDLVIYPVTSLRLAMKTVRESFETIRDEETQKSLLGQMQTRSELYDLIQYERYNTFDDSIYNFSLDDDRSTTGTEGT